MSLTVVGNKPEGSKLVVTLEGDSYSEVVDYTAKNMAIEEGMKKLGKCGIAGTSGPYPVDEKGREILDGNALAKFAQHNKTLKYRNDFDIQQSLVG